MLENSSPARVAKTRYQDAFNSSIFLAPPEVAVRKAPPGKRRDQRTSELFGNSVDDKDLRKQAGTFEPRVDPLSPRRRKIKFLQGGVIPEGNGIRWSHGVIPEGKGGMRGGVILGGEWWERNWGLAVFCRLEVECDAGFGGGGRQLRKVWGKDGGD